VDDVLVVESVPEIPILLHVEPEIGRRAEQLAETARRIGRDSSLAVYDLVNSRI
jgi:hypothetical protein